MVRSFSSKSKNPWTDEENASQKSAFASATASRNGSTIPKKIGFRRCGKSSRVRKTDNSGTKLESFTPEEEDLIIKMHAAMGSRWSLIAQHLPGKTEEEVKMIWNSKLKKKLSQMGIDHVTHRPFSHVLAEYGNINGSGTLNPNPNPFNQTGSIGRNHSLNEDSHQQKPDDSGDLMFHLQAIKLMTDSSNQVKPESMFLNASSSSSNSSPPLFSSSCSTIAQENSEVNFTWSDFLLDQETFHESQQNDPDQELNNLFGNEFNEAPAATMAITSSTIPSQIEEESSSNGFVDSIIAKEKELFFGFSSYLEQPFHF